MESRTPPTREEVEDLKNQWAAYGSRDIEETDGFEAYREELAAFRKVFRGFRAQWLPVYAGQLFSANENMKAESAAGCADELVTTSRWQFSACGAPSRTCRRSSPKSSPSANRSRRSGLGSRFRRDQK